MKTNDQTIQTTPITPTTKRKTTFDLHDLCLVGLLASHAGFVVSAFLVTGLLGTFTLSGFSMTGLYLVVLWIVFDMNVISRSDSRHPTDQKETATP